MRICYIADGRYVHTHRWMSFFADKGYGVHLISFAPLDERQEAAVREAGARYHGVLEGFHLKRFWLTARGLLMVRRVLRREKIDLLHTHFLGVNAWYAALSGFRPFVVTVMGGDVTGPGWRPSDDVREKYLTPHALRRADLVTCWSDKLTRVVRRYTRPGTPVEVVHGGVDLERFTPGARPRYLLERWGLPADARVVLSPRLMRPLYNLDEIARAAREVCAAEPRAYFLFACVPVATDEDYFARVRATVEEGGISDRVRFIGAIPHGEMADHYRLAEAVVSVPGTDGTPMSVLEAMAIGTPVVVSDIPDYDARYIEPGRTVLAAKPEDTRALAAALLRLLGDEGLARSLSAEARRRVLESGGYQAQMSKMDGLYHALVNGARANVD